MHEKTSILETIMMQNSIEQNKASNKLHVEEIKVKEELIQSATVTSNIVSIKKDEKETINAPAASGSSQMETIHNNESSLSLLLCEETIPGSPAPPICGSSGTGFVNNKESSKYFIHFENKQKSVTLLIIPDCKEVPMDIETNETDSKPVKIESIDTPHMNINIGGNGSPDTCGLSSAAVSGNNNDTGVIGMVGTPDSSPRDSLSQDESKSDSEDLKKLCKFHSFTVIGLQNNNAIFASPAHSGISPKKRRRTRKASECELQNKRRRGNYVRGVVTRNNNGEFLISFRTLS